MGNPILGLGILTSLIMTPQNGDNLDLLSWSQVPTRPAS